MRYIFNNLANINAYALPLAAFFILISTSLTNVFFLISVIIGLIICIKKKEYSVLYEKKFLLFSILIYLALLISYIYTIADNSDVFLVLKKYIKFIYIPFIYYYIKKYKNENLIIKFFIYGSTFVLFLSYVKYFNIFDFNLLYELTSIIQFNYTKYNIIETHAVIFQNYIISGIIICFLCYINLILGINNKSILNYLISLFSFIFIIFMNDSRTSYIIISLLLIFIFYKYFFERKIIFFITSIIVFSFLMLSPFSDNLTDRISKINEDVVKIYNNDFDSSVGLRYGWVLCGISNIKNNPFLGNGVGSYKKLSNNCIDTKDVNLNDTFISNNPHNEFVSLSTQIGLAGLFLYVIFLFNLYLDSKNNILAQGAFIIIFISSIFNSAIYDNILGLFIVLIIGITHQKNVGYPMLGKHNNKIFS
ncbi:MAG: O-antigen ligase family protein [Gammaproteobacteria bacterium]|jgi:O-antigen ligase|nr:O-antigen ligase family protein [Gammaproteobacteria bacterium]MBT7604025.1 O-antigen ligase family protein [Gammaproteobacteria bacterium]